MSRPSLEFTGGRDVVGLRRIGKRIVFELDGGLFLVLHLMIAGRLRWKAPGDQDPAQTRTRGLRLSVRQPVAHRGRVRRGGLRCTSFAARTNCRNHDPGGLEPLEADLAAFRTALTRERHTLKRTLTDPRLFSGIGNAYSDEILHRARLSPFKLSDGVTEEESAAAVLEAMRRTLSEWVERLRRETGERFPEKVTAFREGMAVHGRYGQPCPACETPVQRIVYSQNEANYCAECQTGGKLLADRALSRLLKGDWPKTLEALELRKRDSSR